MSIPFTQFLLPHGEHKSVLVERPLEIEAKAQILIEWGYEFEIEKLSTGEIHMDCCHIEADIPISTQICDDGPGVMNAVDRLVNRAYELTKG